jgi:hypothetical protein
MKAAIEFLRSGVLPFDVRETFEIVACLEAANRSRDHAGQNTRLKRL